MFIPQEGSRFKYRPTGSVFEVKKVTSQFVILNSTDGLTQIMVEKKNFTHLFDLEEVPQMEKTHEDCGQDILGPKGIQQEPERQEKSI
jgi:hypothetical protein